MHASLLFIVSSQIEIISYQSSTRFHKSLYSKDFKKAFNDYYDDTKINIVLFPFFLFFFSVLLDPILNANANHGVQ